MPHDWVASASRIVKALAGSRRNDKVPLFFLIDEQIVSRIIGKTTRELLSSPKIFANALIMTAEFIKNDIISIPTAYAGPAEAHAFAEVNNKLDAIKWSDYKALSIQQGVVCKTEEDIDKLEIPDHSKSTIWRTTFETAKVIEEKTKFPQSLGLGIWSIVQELRGVSAYRDIRRNPDLLMKLCEKIYESQLDCYNCWMDEIGHSPYINYTGYAFNKQMMSFDDAMKYEGEFIKRFQKEIKSPFILHNCCMEPYVDEVCDEINIVAINGSHPLEIEYWVGFRERHPKVAIIGANIDVSREMLTGSTEDVEMKVKENIEALAVKGRYGVGPICCLPWGVPLQNIMAIPNAIQKYGNYPIR